MSVAKKCLAFSGLFEAELLIELMLRHWAHPFADDTDFRNDLLEGAAEVLRASVAGQEMLEGVLPQHMNFVAAVWYAEWNSVNSSAAPKGERQVWLDKVRQAIPSCFCPPDSLP
ncbi:MAG: hypothetical protein ACJ8FY_03095 [Gemmataceae bacterium]